MGKHKIRLDLYTLYTYVRFVVADVYNQDINISLTVWFIRDEIVVQSPQVCGKNGKPNRSHRISKRHATIAIIHHRKWADWMSIWYCFPMEFVGLLSLPPHLSPCRTHLTSLPFAGEIPYFLLLFLPQHEFEVDEQMATHNHRKALTNDIYSITNRFEWAPCHRDWSVTGRRSRKLHAIIR